MGTFTAGVAEGPMHHRSASSVDRRSDDPRYSEHWDDAPVANTVIKAKSLLRTGNTNIR